MYIMYYPFSPAGFFVNLGVLCLTQPPPPQLPHPINKLMALSTPYLLMKRKGIDTRGILRDNNANMTDGIWHKRSISTALGLKVIRKIPQELHEKIHLR